MCSTMLLVVQSTMVLGRSVRGSAAKATMTSYAFIRSWPRTGAAAARMAYVATSTFRIRTRASSLYVGLCGCVCLERLHVSRHRRVVPVAGALERIPETDRPWMIVLDEGGDPPRGQARQDRVHLAHE